MLRIRNVQMDTLHLACYRRLCIKFVSQELLLFDCDISDKELHMLFEKFYHQMDINNQNDRLSLVCLLIASVAFQDEFIQQEITQILSESMTPESRSQMIQHVLLLHAGYDSEFLHRKIWI